MLTRAMYLPKVALYVPNSGQKLERLDYRVEQWDPALRAYVKVNLICMNRKFVYFHHSRNFFVTLSSFR